MSLSYSNDHHLGSVWYHSEPSEGPYSPNQYVTSQELFLPFLTANRLQQNEWIIELITLEMSNVCKCKEMGVYFQPSQLSRHMKIVEPFTYIGYRLQISAYVRQYLLAFFLRSNGQRDLEQQLKDGFINTFYSFFSTKHL